MINDNTNQNFTNIKYVKLLGKHFTVGLYLILFFNVVFD